MSFPLTWGFDRGIGTTVPLSPYGTGGVGVVGTPTPNRAVIISGYAGGGIIALEEDADSPTVERGIQCTAQHRFTMSYVDAYAIIAVMGMGTIVQDSSGNIWRVLTCSIQSQPGYAAKLITVSESVSFDLPPDDFQINSVDLGIDIIKHPRYFPNLYPTPDELGTFVGQVKEAIIRAIQAYRDSPFFPTAQTLNGLLNGFVQNIQTASLGNGSFLITVPNSNYLPNFDFVQDTVIQDGSGTITPPIPISIGGLTNDPTIPVSVTAAAISGSASVQLALAAAQEIITKLWRMEDSPYMAGVEMKWTQYFFLPPDFNFGSYIEDPTFIVPDYFLQPDRPLSELPPRGGLPVVPAEGNNIFVGNSIINPQDFSDDGTTGGFTEISWIRKSDEHVWERGLCKATMTWVGSAIGYFDLQIYSGGERPLIPMDYQKFS